MHLPHGAVTCPGWEERSGVRPLDADQYSLGNSSVVTLRSHSVMIQSFRSRVTWKDENRRSSPDFSAASFCRRSLSLRSPHSP